MGRGQPVLQGGGETDEFIPLLDDEIEVNGIAEQGLQRSVVRGTVDAAEHLVGMPRSGAGPRLPRSSCR